MNAHTPDLATRSHKVSPATWDPEARTVEVIAATENPVARRDAAGAFAERLTMATLDLTGAVDVPVFDSHHSGSARDTVGIVQSLRVDGDKLVAVLRLSGADDAAPIVQRVAEGTVTGVSVGYSVTGWQESRDGGLRVKSPLRWHLKEISLTPNPADPNSRVRTEKAPGATARPGGISDKRAHPLGGLMPQTQTLAPEDAERTRRAEIRTLVRSAGLAADVADDLIDQDATTETAKAAIFDHMQTPLRP